MADANPVIPTVFDPVAYSVDENKFLLAHLGEPPTVAMSNPLPGAGTHTYFKDGQPVRTVATGPSRKAIEDVITRVYELAEMEKHRGIQWCGVDAVKAAINVYLEQLAKWEHDAKFKGAPRFPSMHVYTDKGRPISGGVGADSGRVSTYFDTNGHRHSLAIPYQGEAQVEWTPDWVKAGKPADPQAGQGGIIDTPTKSRVECSVCGHTESYNEGSQSSKNAARSRLAKHMRTVKDPTKVDAHREALVKEFGGKVPVAGQ